MTTSLCAARASRLVPVLLLSAFLPILFLGLAGCSATNRAAPSDDQEKEEGPAWFEDVTDKVGLDFVHDPGPTDTYFMPQSMASGCAFLHDGDGTLYLYLLHNGGPK